jgi:3-methyladenine DNA glycosylase/8-oxoguanine DNA glycosylase
VPEGETEASWFAKEVEVGLARRFPDGISEQHRAQAAYEVDVITNMGFPGYFLVVSDFIAWARQQGIRVGPGRGSAAGSLASYAMGITELDPLRYGLIFERFLNPDRVSLPDVDVDFDDRRRGEVIRYVTEKYGDDRVAQIVTFGTIKAKQALKDSARVLGMPYSVGERLTKAMPRSIMGKDITLSEIVDPTSERYKEANDFRALLDTDPEARTVFDTATGLENLKRQWGVHAAGVIMSAEPLMEIVPIMMRDDGAIITQFDQPPCEALGLLKMDFLGLRNLTVIEDALANIMNNRGETVTPETLDLDADPERIDPVLARLPVPHRPGARLPGAFCGFEAAVRVVLGQQVTVKAARTLTQRLVARFGQPLATPWPDLDRLFPSAATLAAADPADIGTLGIVRQRVKALQALAGAVVSGEITLHPGAPLQPTLDALCALPGIGDWTAQVIAMRALGWPDAWPASDIGLMNSLGSRDPQVLTAQAEAWRPWRAYAVMRLWHRVETLE